MESLFDTSGQLEFEEFKSLIDEVWRWKEAFDYFDTDKSGSIDFGELQQALIMIGYISARQVTPSINLSPTTYQTVFFSSDTDRSGSISMDEFIKVMLLCGRTIVQLVTELQLSQIRYMELDRDESGRVNMSYDKFVDLIFSIRT